MESSNKRIAKNTLLLYIRMGISMLISLYTSRIVLQTLGEMNYGILNIVSGSVAMFTFLNGALSASASRYLTFELGRKNYEKLRETFTACLVVHILMALIIVILSETVGLWLLNEKLKIPESRMYAAHWVYQISLVTIVVSMIQVPYSAMIIAHERMDIYSYLSVGDIFLRLAAIYMLQLIGGDKLIIWSFILLFLTVLIDGAYIGYCVKMFDSVKLIMHKKVEIYKSLFSYAFWNIIGGLSGMLQSQGINVLLNMFYGPVLNAARGIAYQVQGALYQFSSNFMTASRPQITKLYAAGNIKEMMKLVQFSGCLAFYLNWFFTLPVLLEADFILKIWLGEFPPYTYAFTLLALLLGSVLSMKESRTSATAATGNMRDTNLFVCTILCMSFPISYIFLRLKFDPTCVIWVTMAVTIIGEIVAVFILRRYINFSIREYFLKIYGRCLMIGCLSAIIPMLCHYLLPGGLVRLVAVILVSFMSVGVTVFIFGLSKGQQTTMKDFVVSKYLKVVKSS